MIALKSIRFGDGIRFRLIVIALIAAIPFVWYRIADIRSGAAQHIAATRDEAVKVAVRGAAQQAEVFAKIRTLLSTIARVPAASTMIPAEQCADFLGSVKDTRYWAKNLLVADHGGRIVCSTDAKAIGVNIGDLAYFREALQTGQFSVSDFINSSLDGQPVIATAYPAYAADGTLKGVLIATMKLFSFDRSVADLGRALGARVFLVDAAGEVFARYPDAPATTDGAAAAEIAKAGLDNGSGWLEARDEDGVRRLYGIAALSGTRARLAVGFSIESALAETDTKIRSAYLQAGLIAAIIVLLAWLAGEVFVLSPLRGLLAATRQLAEGNLDARAKVRTTSREFRELAMSFNTMADRLAGLATSDSLTGIANRRRFEQYLDDEWRRALRAQSTIAVALIDIDGFKLFNDAHGHQTGDACLRIVAKELARHARRSEDLVGRYGGEEFIVGLPGLGEAEAYRHCERARAAIESLAYPELGLSAGAITISIGVAVMLPIPGATSDRLVAMADTALYEAKRAGRNRVALYRAGPVPAAIRVA